MPLVKRYLGAIAEGDADAAAALDDAAVKREAEQTSRSEFGDLDALRSSAVLEKAEQRISDVSVDETSKAEPGSAGDERRVSFEFTLDGEQHSSSLGIGWNDEAQEWELRESLTVWMSVVAVRSVASMEPAPFTVPGTAETLSTDPTVPAADYLAYPGVYAVNAAFDSALLQRGSTRRQAVEVVPEQDALVQFDVTALPSSAS
ncbi:hypothetical protein CW368_08365 [Actinomycetales bacterium SN12]|nr:hypothetical protein CW368_08365 [Actinomycetales bacterium SN12]